MKKYQTRYNGDLVQTIELPSISELKMHMEYNYGVFQELKDKLLNEHGTLVAFVRVGSETLMHPRGWYEVYECPQDQK